MPLQFTNFRFVFSFRLQIYEFYSKLRKKIGRKISEIYILFYISRLQISISHTFVFH